jgi:hypothetical protein
MDDGQPGFTSVDNEIKEDNQGRGVRRKNEHRNKL